MALGVLWSKTLRLSRLDRSDLGRFLQIPGSHGDRMYRSNRQQLEFPDCCLPFSGQLNPDNRWVKLATLVPWGLAEEIYHADLCEDFGAPVIPSRVALGALIIKERLGLTDRETVETIGENPYLQFFIGNGEFSLERPFDASLMVDFRKRFGEDGVQRIAEAIALASLKSQAQNKPTLAVKNDEADDDVPPPAATDSSNPETPVDSDVSPEPAERQPPTAQISLTFLVMNLELALRRLFLSLCWLLGMVAGSSRLSHRITP